MQAQVVSKLLLVIAFPQKSWCLRKWVIKKKNEVRDAFFLSRSPFRNTQGVQKSEVLQILGVWLLRNSWHLFSWKVFETVTCHFVQPHFNRCNFHRSHFQPSTLSTDCLFDRLQFQLAQIRPIYLVSRFFNFFKTFENSKSNWRFNLKSSSRQFYVIFKGHIGQATICTKIENDFYKLHQKEIRCNLHLNKTTNLKGLWFLVTGSEHFLKR